MYEWNEKKNESNKAKHKISFEEGISIFEDPYAHTEEAASTTEPRYVTLGTVKEKVWAAFYTFRDDNIRIISIRRARDKERKLYESQKQG